MSHNFLQSHHSSYSLIQNFTSIQPLANLNKTLDGVEIYAKRDDVMDIGLGGNKLRKLEYLLQDAISKGADTLITTGGIQSNHARLTAVAAAKAGLQCELILTQPVPVTTQEYNLNGNILLEKLLNVPTQIVPKGQAAADFIAERQATLKAAGRQSYVIPMGGSSALGCLGYTNCFFEIQEQSKISATEFGYIAIPNGSSGTHAGLLAGKKLAKDEHTQIISYSVLAPAVTSIQTTVSRTNETLEILGVNTPVTAADVRIDDSYLGPGYGLPTTEMWQALRLLAQTEGIFLDPVYSGKAFAGLLADIRKGIYPKGSKVLFIMTGGIPGLFGYESYISSL